MSSDIDALYKRAKAVLWVEDPETRAFLGAVWQGLAPTIEVLVAGGQSNVDAVCEQARTAGVTHVFGLVDQDFGNSNRDRWPTLNVDERVYRLDVHEVENLLLDAVALQGCKLNTCKRTVQQIQTKIDAEAQNRAYWVACVRFLAETRRNAMAGYPPNPRTTASLADAANHVGNSVWFSSTAIACPTLANSARVSVELQTAHTAAIAALGNGDWTTSFPGKEIFRVINGYVQQSARGLSGRIDLVKAVGEWQRDNGRVPKQATDLRNAIVGRVKP